jgi:hypothetical protein
MKVKILICLVFLAGTAMAQEKETVGANLCYAENVTAAKGSSFSVGVFVNNVDTLAGMQVPIYYSSDEVDLSCDSVTFHNSRCADFTVKDFNIEPDGKIAYFVLIDMLRKKLPPGEGPVASLWFTAREKAGSGTVELRSGQGSSYPDEKLDLSYLFWQPSSQQIEFPYKAGKIVIE